MQVRKVQQFQAVDDDFVEFGDPQLIDLTEEELAALHENGSEPILLEEKAGFFMLLD